ncbi:DUF1579 family protein [Pedobacter sp. JCM 36344]|uniref:DUF1579 family protein n=1 Tax=Pedobacter sp. JCM 36344 TaxID=3374280 RepID=UPI00397810C3
MKKENQKLNIFVGEWKAIGKSYAEGNSNGNLQVSLVDMSSTETFEWILDDSFLIHHWNGHVGNAEFNGMEVLGFDILSQTYISSFFDNAGNSPTYKVTFQNNVWTYIGELQRATFKFSDDGKSMKTHWDWKKNPDENWLPLCDLTVTKTI